MKEGPVTFFFVVLPALYPSRNWLIWDAWSPSSNLSEPSTFTKKHFKSIPKYSEFSI